MAPILVPIAVATAVPAAALAARRRFLGRSLPRTRGSVEVEGLAKPVRIRRDRRGTPNLYADSMPDAAFAMGYVHAQDRLWQMDFNRRVAAGRISEIAGSVGVAADRLVRRVGLVRLASAEARLLNGEAKIMLEAYSAGVNALIQGSRALPLEFRLTRTAPDPWLPEHSLSIAKLLALGLSLNWDGELQRLELLRTLGPERAARVDLFDRGDDPSVVGLTAEAATSAAPAVRVASIADHFQEAARWFPTQGGCSNSWVVSGARTATGRPLLCNDPHLPPTAPGLWYAAHVRAGSDFETTGATIAGLPFPLLGHNRDCAWGYTNSFADTQDLVIEEFEDATGRRYRTEAGGAESRFVREVVRIKDASDVIEDVIVTRHGPLVEPIAQAPDGRWRGLALQWTANAPAATADCMLKLQRAHDWPSFKAAFSGLDAPSQNVIYADVLGHIGYFLNGRIPVRRRAPSPLPVPGWTGDALWERFLDEHEAPQVLDPPENLIVTANNRVVGDGFPHYIAADYMNSYRARRIRELMSDPDRPLTREQMVAFQLDMVCPPAREMVALLRSGPVYEGRGEQLRRRLVAWDCVMDGRRTEPTMYEAFMRRLAHNALAPLCQDDWGTVAGTTLSHPLFSYPGNVIGRLTPVLLDRWRRDDAELFDGTTTWAEVVGRSLAEAAADVGRRRRWGRAHAMRIVHRPFGSHPALRFLFDAGTIKIGGDGDTILATSFSPAEPFRTTLFAPSWRQVIDVGDWDAATAIHFPGQSGQLGSRHRRDLVRRWRKNRQLPMDWSRDAVRRRGRRILTLNPVPTPALERREAA